MVKLQSSNWEMAIQIYMFHLNMTREQACLALGISDPDKSKDLGKACSALTSAQPKVRQSSFN